MKKIFRPLFAVMAIALVASCTEQIDNNVTSGTDNLVKMTFSASMSEDVDSKTTYLSRKVYWEASDAITVFSVGEDVTTTSFAEPELLENRTVARFTGLADASAETYYAVYPHSEANTYADGTFSVTFPAEQTAVANGFESGSNVSVAVSIKDAEVTEQSLQFKNVGALLAFSFKDLETALNTASVTFKAKKSDTEYWGLAGATTFTLDENNLPVAAEGDKQEVVVNAPEGGFTTGIVYFIPVIPVGACTGMEVSYTDLNGDTYTKNNDVDFKLLRSYMFNVGQLPRPSYLPKDFTITLDFTKGWPFSTPIATAQAKGGETYIYTLQVDDKKVNLPVVIDGNGSSYEMNSSGIYFTEASSIVKSPAFVDRYVTRVEADKTRLRRLRLPDGESSPWYIRNYDCSYYADKTILKYDVENPVNTLASSVVTYDSITAEKNKSYTIKTVDKGMTITKVAFTYSSTAPGNAPTE